MIDIKNVHAWNELIKFLLRITILGGAGVLVGSLINLLPQVDNEALKAILGVVLIAADKWIHNNKNISYKGLLPF